MPNANPTHPNPTTRPGELRARVAEVLAASPSTSFTVTELSKKLGHSGGAIGNACETLYARGEAARANQKPRRYTATNATATAAQAPTRTSPPRAATNPTNGRMAHNTRTRRPRNAPPNTQTVKRTYKPRRLAGMPDTDALRRLRSSDVPVLLYGPPGTGKTSLIEAAFPDLITVAGDGDTEVGDLIGEYSQRDDGGFEFNYGPLVNAMQEGRALLLDDATLISPKVLAAMYPAMDGRRQIQVKAHKGETVTAAQGFYVIAGHNPGVHGAVLTEALSSRFSVQVQVCSDYDLAESLSINRTAVRVARDIARHQNLGEVNWAPQLRELIAFQKVATALGSDAAFANLVGVAPLEDRDIIADLVAKHVGHKVSALALGRQI